jgi:gluconokinase
MSPSVIVVMGVSGCGKTTIAEGLASRLRWPYAEADTFHPRGNVDKMRAGIPLTDEDRWPWLDAMRAWIDSTRAEGRRCIVTCSALKRAYRERLAQGRDDVRLVHLAGSYDLIASRMASRRHEYMPASLLKSQFDILEAPGDDENPLVLPIDREPDELVREIVAKLALRPS